MPWEQKSFTTYTSNETYPNKITDMLPDTSSVLQDIYSCSLIWKI